MSWAAGEYVIEALKSILKIQYRSPASTAPATTSPTRLPSPSTPAANYRTAADSETFTNSRPCWQATPANWLAIFCTSSRFIQPEHRSGSRIVRRLSQYSMRANRTDIEYAISFTHSCRAGFFLERMVADDTSHTHSPSFSSRNRSHACVAFSGECTPGVGQG